MRNWDISAADRAKAHSRHGEKLQVQLDRAQGELDRRQAPLHTTRHGIYIWEQPRPEMPQSRN